MIMVLLKLLPFFKPAGLTACIISASLFIAHLEFPSNFCTYEGTMPYKSSAQISRQEEVGVSFVALGILEPQTARH
jgi:hypothetical protein